jgi:isopentenyl-diphosphate delta-isomerase type 1
MEKKYVDVVDKNDKVIGKITEEEATYVHDKITRSVSIFVYNSKGELFLQKRSRTKVRFPLHWDISVGGFVDAGESHDKAAVRELEEELGIKKKPKQLEFLFKKLIQTDRMEIAKVYALETDEPISINRDEIAEGKYFSISEINKMIHDKKELITPHFLLLFKEVGYLTY